MRTCIVAIAFVLAASGQAKAIESATIKIELVDNYDYHFTADSRFMTSFHFPGHIDSASIGNKRNYHFDVDFRARQINVQPEPRAPVTNINVSTSDAIVSILIS